MGSESGVLPVPDSKIVRKWRLQPGKMFLIDLEQGRMIDDEELNHNLCQQQALRPVDREPAHPPRRRGAAGRRQSDGAAGGGVLRRGGRRRCWTASRPSAHARKTSSS